MSVFKDRTLEAADLIVDAVYEGSRTANGGITDPLTVVTGVSRQGGFRYRGTKENPTLIVLTSNLAEPDWPDELDPTSGRFIYYGDNRHPGRELHDTPRFGNQLLRLLFDRLHLGQRHLIPPVFIFTSLGANRAFRFRGLAVPGFAATPPTDDLVAVWKTSNDQRFQNYKATFTVLDVPKIDRRWIAAADNGVPSAQDGPEPWRAWVEKGAYTPLMAPRARIVRTRREQLPESPADKEVIEQIRMKYRNDPYGFEACAGEIAKLLLPDITQLELTRPYRDGGRDAIGQLRIGRGAASISVTFALEAKCYREANSVGVEELSRLISRIRHREFGILVTTSAVDRQAYSEVVDDGHPIIIVSAVDIVRLLRECGYATPGQVAEWLQGIVPAT